MLNLTYQENFIKIKEYYINLDNVSSFKIEPNKLIFNMAYTTETHSGFKSDFIFVDNYIPEELNRILESEYFKKIFIKIFNGSTDAYINRNCISSFKFEKEKNRYIINFNTVHTYEFSPNKTKVLAEFMYAYV